MKSLALAAALLFVAPATADPAPRYHRSYAAKVEFARTHPCPSTGQPVPHCPGYVIDHIYPLCAGGPDAPSNMQWQNYHDGHVKDKWEWRLCRALHPRSTSHSTRQDRE